MVTPEPQGPTFIDVPYYDMPYPHDQPSPTTYSPSFEEKVLQALDKININNQILHSHTLALTELETQVSQLAITLNREEEGELPSLSESNLEGPYLNENFNSPTLYPEQSKGTLENKLVIEHPCITLKTNNLTKAHISWEKSNWWDEPIPSSSYLPIASFPSTLESSTPFYGKERQLDQMLELGETSQGPQMNSIIEEAAPTIFFQDSLDPSLAHLEIYDFNVNGHITKVNDHVEMPNLKTIPLWIEQYEPSPNPPIAPC